MATRFTPSLRSFCATLARFVRGRWFVNCAVLIVAAIVAGAIFEYSSFSDPRWLYNGWVRLSVVGIAVVAIVWRTALLERRALRRRQFSVLMSLLLHLEIVLALQSFPVVAVSAVKQSPEQAVFEVIEAPADLENDYTFRVPRKPREPKPADLVEQGPLEAAAVDLARQDQHSFAPDLADTNPVGPSSEAPLPSSFEPSRAEIRENAQESTVLAAPDRQQFTPEVPLDEPIEPAKVQEVDGDEPASANPDDLPRQRVTLSPDAVLDESASPSTESAISTAETSLPTRAVIVSPPDIDTTAALPAVTRSAVTPEAAAAEELVIRQAPQADQPSEVAPAAADAIEQVLTPTPASDIVTASHLEPTTPALSRNDVPRAAEIDSVPEVSPIAATATARTANYVDAAAVASYIEAQGSVASETIGPTTELVPTNGAVERNSQSDQTIRFQPAERIPTSIEPANVPAAIVGNSPERAATTNAPAPQVLEAVPAPVGRQSVVADLEVAPASIEELPELKPIPIEAASADKRTEAAPAPVSLGRVNSSTPALPSAVTAHDNISNGDSTPSSAQPARAIPAPASAATSNSYLSHEVVSPGENLVLDRSFAEPNVNARIVENPFPEFRQRKPAERERMAASRGATVDSEAAVERGLEFLSRHQSPNGRWTLDKFHNDRPGYESAGLAHMKSDTGATGLALLAYFGAGYTHLDGKYRTPIGRALDFLVSNQKSSGDLFTTGARNSWLDSHSIASIALCEAYGMTQDPRLRDPAQRALDFIVASADPAQADERETSRRPTGISISGWQMMALRSGELSGLNVPRTTTNRLADRLDFAPVGGEPRQGYVFLPASRQDQQRTASLVVTAEALLMQLHLGWESNDARLLAGADYLLANPPDYGTSHQLTRDAYYWFFATQVMYQVQGPHWEAWNERLRELLVDGQEREGVLAGSWDPIDPLPDRWGRQAGRVYVTAMHLLILEVYYRQLPLYRGLGK